LKFLEQSQEIRPGFQTERRRQNHGVASVSFSEAGSERAAAPTRLTVPQVQERRRAAAEARRSIVWPTIGEARLNTEFTIAGQRDH
jgi:hypothetical protein